MEVMEAHIISKLSHKDIELLDYLEEMETGWIDLVSFLAKPNTIPAKLKSLRNI